MRHRDMLWRVCWYRANRDRDRCCDLLQEVSIALWENYDKLQPGSTPRQERAWIRWQARSVFYQIERRPQLPTVPLSETNADNIPVDRVCLDNDNGNNQRKELIEELLAALNSDEQKMVRLYLDGYHGDEIGKTMGISRNNYYQRMHRIILKMRPIALIVLAMLFASAIAIAVVPQWRNTIFNVMEPADTVQDSLPIQSSAQHSKSKIQDSLSSDSAGVGACVPILSADSKYEIRNSKLECLPPLSPLVGMQTFTDGESNVADGVPTISSDARKRDLTLAINGSYFTIPGAAGESVRVYDMNGNLVFAQKPGSLCIIDLLPNFNAFFVRDYYQYKLQIGSRPTMLIIL